ncbi:MAG TPA: DUF1549 and DUF1553 domain-containing protein [Gemmataceae bacterium]|nr:DUF1549 and DUF1553 domain-containing protein [Gemmataceae bacterium]
MTRLCLTFALLAVAGPAVASEKTPMPRVVTPALIVDEAIRKIDGHLTAFWSKNGIQPAPVADDAEFLRRLSLDLVGRIPTASEARAFIESKDPEKRTKKIDELIGKPGYLNHFASVFRRTWVPQTADNRQLEFVVPFFEQWIRGKLKDNVPMDQVVREMVTVKTLFAGKGAETFRLEQTESPFAFVQANEFKPENVAAATSRLFMGVKIECAQCHNHPFAPYKKEQFWELAAFFAEVQPTIANISDPKFKREIKIPDVPKTVQARFFNDSREPVWDAKKSPRETFADWLTAKDNPFFARNMVNRMWAHFLGLGLVEPIDEPSEDNPPAIPELLDDLSRMYAASGYDLRFLLRVVTRSKAYQLTSKQSHASHADAKRFARVAVKSMSGEQLFDSLAIATGYHDGMSMRDRQFGGIRREFITKFGSTEKLTEKQTSILQALTLMNGRFVNDQTSIDRSTFLAGVIDAPFLDSAGKVETMFLGTLSRMPTQGEAEKFGSYVDRGGVTGDKKKAVTDVYWALLNSSEFVLNH